MAVNLLTDVPPALHRGPNGLLPRPTISYQGRSHWISDYAELSDKLFDLSWLPDSAWIREEPQAYQPDWWETCYGGAGFPVDRRQLLDRLPAHVAAVLRGKNTTTVPFEWDVGQPTQESVQYCTVISTREWQVIAQALRAAGSPAENGATPRRDHRLPPTIAQRREHPVRRLVRRPTRCRGRGQHSRRPRRLV